MKKIVFIVNYFYPDLASTGQLMTDLCKGIDKEYHVTVIAAQPGYAGEVVNSNKLYDISKFHNSKVIRIKLPEVNKNSKFSRIKYILSYFVFAVYAVIREKNVDIIYTISQPPIIGGLIGSLGKLIKRTKHIYNIQDFNPEQTMAIGYVGNKFILNIAKRIDKFNCKLSDKLILVGNDMIQTLSKRFENSQIPSYEVINNWTDEEDIVPLRKSDTELMKMRKKFNLEGKFVIMYSGNIGLYYDLENIIKITESLMKYDKIKFVFIGEGAMKETMQSYVKNNHITNVLFLPYQDKKKLKYSLNLADAHLVVNQKGIKGVSVPSKIYGVLAAGKPAIGVLEKESEAEQIINSSKSGFVVEPNAYNDLINLIEKMYMMSPKELDEMGKRGRLYLENNLRKNDSIARYKKVFDSI